MEAAELIRELRLLKDAGIGGVEINPVQFPSRFEGDDLGKPSLQWLSDEWIGMLRVVFEEAASLGMTCDLIVGSGWPFGSEDIIEEERSRIVTIACHQNSPVLLTTPSQGTKSLPGLTLLSVPHGPGAQAGSCH
ncbi:MAG: hypothetical protein U5L72_02005 [Bacteroidales bacterium]|nr:hypothetical protein [Bacteroidales bacterium]